MTYGTQNVRAFDNMINDRVVYVRPVYFVDLPDDVKAEIPETDYVFAVHDPDGERLGFAHDRAMAFSMALERDLSPVNVH